jgi:hypothetical protein
VFRLAIDNPLSADSFPETLSLIDNGKKLKMRRLIENVHDWWEKFFQRFA